MGSLGVLFYDNNIFIPIFCISDIIVIVLGVQLGYFILDFFRTVSLRGAQFTCVSALC